MDLLIIADDLSGAADCAIGCAGAGRRTVVGVQPRESEHATGGGSLAVDTDTRRLSPSEATERTVAAYVKLRSDRRRLYKKIDSTLRGNWAAEVAGLVPLAGLAIVAPAHPATGRTVRNGRVFVHGCALEDTETWQLEHRHRPANIAAQLEEAGLSVATLDVDPSDNPDSLAERLSRLAARPVDALIVGAESTDTLQCLARASLRLTRPVFWVGSGGLARELAEAAPPGARLATDTPQRSEGPTLIVAGSLSAVTRRQIAKLARHDAITAIVVPPACLHAGPSSGAWEALQHAMGDALDRGRDVLLQIGRDDNVDPADGAHLSAALARLAAPYYARLGGLIATGGETARAMLVEAGVEHLLVLDEVEAGVIVGVPVGTQLTRHPWVVTKAGAFGDDETLAHAWRTLSQPLDPSASVARISPQAAHTLSRHLP